MNSGRGVTRLQFLVLGLLAAIAPLAIDLYLPSFPEVRTDLGTDASSVQLTLTAFLVGIAVGQILWGPITDRLGRRRPLLVGCAVSLAASLVAVFAPTIGVLIGARFVQAMSGAAGVVIARAMIADRTNGLATARAMSLLMAITGAAPVVAPIIGGLLAGHLSWRGILAILTALTAVQLVGAALVLPESLPEDRRAARLDYRDIGRILRRPLFVGYVATVMCSFGMLMTYISSSPFIYQQVIGTSSLSFALLFAMNAAGMSIAGVVSARLAGRGVAPVRTISVALPVAATMAVGVLLVGVSGLSPWALVPLFFMAITCLGFIQGNLLALALDQARDLAGSGSAVFGGLMFLAGGLVSPLGGLGGGDSVVPAGIVMTACGIAGMASWLLVRRATAPHRVAA